MFSCHCLLLLFVCLFVCVYISSLMSLRVYSCIFVYVPVVNSVNKHCKGIIGCKT